MIYKHLSRVIFISILTLTILNSCNSSDNNDDSGEVSQQPIEQYYIKGLLDGEELLLEKNIYESPELNNPYEHSIDYGGSQIYYEENPDTPETGTCQTRFACGFAFYDFQENPEQLDEAKMYFSKIPLSLCNSENETISMENFFNLDTYTYARFPENIVLNNVALDFFPVEFDSNENYYSSRFGDNNNASFDIISATEIEDGIYSVEGTFNCKLYGFNDPTEFKELINGEFKIKIRKNINE
ncbi:hypothetical protein [Winogradskyella sp. MH6]|uniref:hypothetical protein n=1 Tax=Winogradskyella sp. MH6 TaxID=2929510 RepID=UPI001FB40D42|nr:hypothetical protein [Winogradskyella sp. MH6]